MCCPVHYYVHWHQFQLQVPHPLLRFWKSKVPELVFYYILYYYIPSALKHLDIIIDTMLPCYVVKVQLVYLQPLLRETLCGKTDASLFLIHRHTYWFPGAHVHRIVHLFIGYWLSVILSVEIFTLLRRITKSSIL